MPAKQLALWFKYERYLAYSHTLGTFKFPLLM